MKKNLLVWQVGGATFIAVLSTVLHFLFQWTDLIIFAPISAVNESTWEHMKLIFIPSLIFAFIQSFFAKNDYPCFWLVKLIGVLLGTLLIPVLFYTLSGAFGPLLDVINIAIFFVAVIAACFVEYVIFDKIYCKYKLKWFYISVLLVVFILFAIFAFYPPQIPLFLDPITYGYGIIK